MGEEKRVERTDTREMRDRSRASDSLAPVHIHTHTSRMTAWLPFRMGNCHKFSKVSALVNLP
jgi:hypothetical protein